MVEIIRHDGVTEWRFSSRISRATGYTASAFLTDDGVLIDTGIPAAADDLRRLLDRTAIRGVMITHHHEDHAGNVELIAQRGIPVWMAAATLPFVTDVAPIRAYRHLTWRPMTPLRSAVIPFDGGEYQAVFTPGHSPDHHAIWHAPTRTLFSGDLFLGVAVRIVHHDEDLHTTIASLERAAALEPVRLLDAHRGLLPDGAGALRAKAAWTQRMIEAITARIARGESDAAILKAEMGGESLTGLASRGEYSRRNFIASVRHHQDGRGRSGVPSHS